MGRRLPRAASGALGAAGVVSAEGLLVVVALEVLLGLEASTLDLDSGGRYRRKVGVES